MLGIITNLFKKENESKIGNGKSQWNCDVDFVVSPFANWIRYQHDRTFMGL